MKPLLNARAPSWQSPHRGAAGPAGPDLMTGLSGAGFEQGPAAAEAVADLILGSGPEWVDLHPFR